MILLAVLFPGREPPADIVVVDGIEFDESVRQADPVADMAFLSMELIVHERRDSFRNAYCSAANDLEGEQLLPFLCGLPRGVVAEVRSGG